MNLFTRANVRNFLLRHLNLSLSRAFTFLRELSSSLFGLIERISVQINLGRPSRDTLRNSSIQLFNVRAKNLNFVFNHEWLKNKLDCHFQYCLNNRTHYSIILIKITQHACLMRSAGVVTSGVSRIRNEFWETIEINSSVLQRHGAVLSQNGRRTKRSSLLL